jgi:folate-binding protein YgfZ
MQDDPRQYFYLPHFALIEISGRDAFEFLHKQITCDLNELQSLGWLFCAWCEANGRVICTFIVYQRDDSLFLIFPSPLKERIMQRLSRYTLRSRVIIRDAGEDFSLLGLSNVAILSTDLLDRPARTGRMLNTDHGEAIELWGQKPRYLLVQRVERMPALLNRVSEICDKGDQSGWNLLDIEAGIPWITETTTASFLPQMLNMDKMHSVSYQKGCYPGQEVIARLRYRGQLKKRMFLGNGQGEFIPAAGGVIELTDSGNPCGSVIAAERNPEGVSACWP